jgi:hypothetical protein
VESRLLFIGAILSGLGIAGLISYRAFHVATGLGIAGLFFSIGGDCIISSLFYC